MNIEPLPGTGMHSALSLSLLTKTIGLHGALDVDNFGDVLLGRIFADWVRQAGFTPTAPAAPPGIAAQMGAQPTGTTAPAAILFIGGGYFGEPQCSLKGRWKWGFRMVNRRLRPAAADLLRKCPYAIVGVGAGPITNILSRMVVKRVCDGAARVAVRDDESAAFLKSIGTGHNIEVTADAVLGLTRADLNEAAEEKEADMKALAAGRPIILVHLAQQTTPPLQWRLLVASLHEWLRNRNALVVALTDQRGTRPSIRQEQDAAEFAALHAGGISVVYEGVDSLLGTIAAADLVITTKLHVGIVASALGVKVAAFADHIKTERLYRQIGASEFCLPWSKWSQDAITSLLDRRSESSAHSVPARVQEASLRNSSIIRSFLASINQ